MRVYVPTTLAALRDHVAAGVVPASVERFVAGADDEESEYDAVAAAAEASGELLSGPGRRVVVVAEVDDPDAEVPIGRVRAVHSDTDDVDPGAVDLPDLAWYATQEISDLLTSNG